MNGKNVIKDLEQSFDPQLFRIITFIFYFQWTSCTALSFSKKTTYVELYLYINIIGAIPSFYLQDHRLQNVGCIVALRRGLKPSKYRHLFSYIEGRLLAMV